ncbi:Slc8a2 [Symbiodinium natans]|uniref:Slc8a2 protein n=1 Tax=Symbiodinium natans TaxID=878477 RepID=A0A812JSG4_9DINO|nr:Slc8a2 [Symbiodinium natans]
MSFLPLFSEPRIFAYLWLLLIVQVISPNVVEIWEALITFLMFPLLVTISWMANKGKLGFLALEKKSEEETGLLAAPAYNEPTNNMRKSQHPRINHAPTTVGVTNRRASQLSNRRNSQLSAGRAPTEVEAAPKEARDASCGEEDQKSPAGSMNGKDILDPKTNEAFIAPNGVITFRSDSIEVNTSETDCTGQDGYTLSVEILRCNGSEGEVSCKLETEGLSAVPGKDFEPKVEKVIFQPGIDKAKVQVQILQQRLSEPDDVLQLVLSEAEGGAIFNPHDDGGREMSLLTITIKNSSEPPLGERIIDPDNFARGLEEWKEQILSSWRLEEPEAEDGEEPARLGPSDYVFFVLGLPFKLFFGVMCPPACWAGGFLLFVVALAWVAVVTALISDLASLFGCCAGLPDATTAITIVAMGTSLPDTFASMASASKDDTADSSIVNVTGSNSVNVYLGIGIPWLAAAIYWTNGPLDAWRARYRDIPETLAKYPSGAFVVKAGALGFSVLLFNCVGIICLVILRVRRLALGGELGGPKRPAWACSITLVVLWSIYIASSIWRNASTDAEVMIYPLAVLAVLAVIGGLAFELSGKGRYDPSAEEARKSQQEPAKDFDSHMVVNVEDTGKNVDEGLEPKKIGASEDMIVSNLQEAPMGETAAIGAGEDAMEPAPEPVGTPPSPEAPPDLPAAKEEAPPDVPAAQEEEPPKAEEGEKKKTKGPKKSTTDAASKKAAAKKKSEVVKEPKKSKVESPEPSKEAPAALPAEPPAVPPDLPEPPAAV